MAQRIIANSFKRLWIVGVALLGLWGGVPLQLFAVDAATIDQCGYYFASANNPQLQEWIDNGNMSARSANEALSAGDVTSFNANLASLGNATMVSIFEIAWMADQRLPINLIAGNPSMLTCLREDPSWSAAFEAVNGLVSSYYSLLVQGAVQFGSDSITVASKLFSHLLLPTASNSVLTSTSQVIRQPNSSLSDPRQLTHWIIWTTNL